MEKIFGKSIVTVQDGTAAQEWCVQLQKDIRQRSELGKQVRDIVLAQHTWQHRLAQLNRDLGLY